MSRGLGLDVAAVIVEASDDFDRRADAHVPALLSVTVTGEPSPPTATKSQREATQVKRRKRPRPPHEAAAGGEFG